MDLDVIKNKFEEYHSDLRKLKAIFKVKYSLFRVPDIALISFLEISMTLSNYQLQTNDGMKTTLYSSLSRYQ